MLRMAGFITFTFSVRVCVCVCVCLWTRYLKKYSTNQLPVWGEPSLSPKEETIRF